MVCKLSERDPVIVGGEKYLYLHPDDPGLIIKIWRQKHFDSIKIKHPVLARFMRLPHYTALLKEIREHIAVREQEADARFIQKIIGIIDTDMGLGLIVESIRKKDGRLAKTLLQLIEEKRYEHKHEQGLERLFDWMLHTDVIIRDFTFRNMVWDEMNEHFVIIDGIGSKPTISLRPVWRAYNRRGNKNRINKLRRRLANLKKPHE